MKQRLMALGIAGGVTFLIGLLANWLCLPAWTIQSGGFWWFIIIHAIIFCIISFIVESVIDEETPNLSWCAVIITIVIIVIGIILSIAGSKMFNASKYQKLIEIETGNFEADVTSVANVKDITVVDVKTAERLGDRTIGGLKNAPWFEVDNEYNLIIYKGEQYRVSPLNYGGLFKYNKAKKDGLPGYVLVNTRTQEAKLIELEKGMNYSPSAYFSKDLTRHLRNQYGSYIFGKSFFEIDETGKPYWVTSVKESTIGLFGGKTIKSIIITDAVTGKSKEFSIDKIPTWVDHAYDVEYLMERIDWNMEYIHGYWNTWFSNTDVRMTSYSYKDEDFAGYNTQISNGEVVFYTGVTPVSKAESNLGFLLVNSRTGKVKYYEAPGAEESSAQKAAEGLVQNLGYKATFPTMINVDGEETYFMALKDGAGLVQRYALCNVKNYAIVVESATLEDTLSKYRQKLGHNTKKNIKETLKVEGTISNMYNAQIDGYTYFYFKLDGSDDLYMSSIENGNKQVTLTVGKHVQLEYVETSEKGVYIVNKIDF